MEDPAFCDWSISPRVYRTGKTVPAVAFEKLKSLSIPFPTPSFDLYRGIMIIVPKLRGSETWLAFTRLQPEDFTTHVQQRKLLKTEYHPIGVDLVTQGYKAEGWLSCVTFLLKDACLPTILSYAPVGGLKLSSDCRLPGAVTAHAQPHRVNAATPLTFWVRIWP